MHQSSHHHHRNGTVGAKTATPGGATDLNATAFWATVHCLTGCSIGEVFGMVIGTGLGLSNGATIVIAVALAFLFGYAFTVLPLHRAGMAWQQISRLAFAADTASITIMEIVDNAMMLAIPGAMDAGVKSPLFWGALTISLVVAGAAAYPVNRWLIAHGKGHAVVHAHHDH